MSDGKKILLALGGFLLVTVIMLVQTRDPDDVDSSSGALSSGSIRSEAIGTGSSAGTDTDPSSENVSHSFFQRRKELEDLIEGNPVDTTSIRLLARLLHDAHQLEGAATWYERYLTFNTSGRQEWLDLASVYATEMNWERAQSTSEQMLEFFPEDPAAQYNLGAIHANQGSLEEARSWWAKVSRQSVDTGLRDRAIQALSSLDSR